MSYNPYGGGYPAAPGYPQPGGMPQPGGPGGYPPAGGMPQPGAYQQSGGMPMPGGFGMPGGGMPQSVPAPAGLPYAAQPYQNQPGYTPSGGYQQQGAYPPAGGMPMPGQSPYPSGSAPYPQGGAPYPGGNPQAGGAPYPTGGAPGGAPYPSGGAPGGAPYPSGGAPGGAPYPSGGAPGQAPYPSGGTPGVAPYSSGGVPGQAPYPSQSAPGGTPYSTGGGHVPSAPSASAPSQHRKSQSTPAASQHTASRVLDTFSTPYYDYAKKPGDSGTVKPLTTGFNPEADATQIRNCLNSTFINETILINILPHRSNAQRQKIRLMYKTMYGKDLMLDMRSKLTGDFESIAVGMMMTPVEYDAYLINKAIQGVGTDEAVLIEILCTRTNSQMRELSAHYKESYKRTIEADLKGDTSSHFGRLVIALANGARQEDQGVNQQKAEEDAKKLYKAGAGKIGTDESTFNSIFASQSFEQLRAVFSAYQRAHNKEMEKVIKSEMSGDLESGMKAIVRFTLDKHGYFAQQLLKAMKGLGTNEKALIRTLVSRSEIDLENIKRAFQNIKGEGKPLSQWIKKETSGPFRDLIVHLCGDAH